MVPSSLALMRCPACFGDLAVASIVERVGEAIEFGLVGCRCSQYPVIQGVLLFGKRDSSSFVQFLANGDVDGLLSHIAEKQWAGGGWFNALEAEWGPKDFLERRPATLFDAADRLRDDAAMPVVREMASHLKYFHATPKYLAARRLIERLPNTDTVLDLGAGAGHLGELVMRETQPRLVVLADVTFRSLLLSRWLLPDPSRCACVRTDANLPLPFKPGVFDAVVSADAIHYIEMKASLFRELRRVLRAGGSTLLTHLHNADHPTEPAQGYSLTAETWTALFDEALPGGRLISDDAVRGGSDDLRSARSFSFVSNLLDAAAARPRGLANAIFNPVYEVVAHADAFELARVSVSPVFDAEHASSEPARITVTAVELADPQRVTELRQRGIIIDVPATMCGRKPI